MEDETKNEESKAAENAPEEPKGEATASDQADGATQEPAAEEEKTVAAV